MEKLVTLFKNVLVAALLVGQVPVAQSVIVVRDVRFVGDLGVPEKELQEYTEFLKGHSLEESKVLEQSGSAVRGALRHRGFLRAQITPTVLDARPSDAITKDDRIIQLTIHPGIQYRVKDVSFSGLSSELSLLNCGKPFIGDIADGNEIGVGIAMLRGLFRKAGKNYVAIAEAKFDDTAHTVSFRFDIEK
jgi:outer membrane protein assembly factor BamA